jgi:endonuclease/exonuclease/phosphatase family metal-dependent hydrolase
MIIMGDFNPKIGKEKHLMKATGKCTIHNETTENGNLLAQFATRNRLPVFIRSTSFQHKKIQMGTWKIPGTSEANQFDHVLVSLRHSSSVIDVGSFRGPNCDSDHYLVRV